MSEQVVFDSNQVSTLQKILAHAPKTAEPANTSPLDRLKKRLARQVPAYTEISELPRVKLGGEYLQKLEPFLKNEKITAAEPFIQGELDSLTVNIFLEAKMDKPLQWENFRKYLLYRLEDKLSKTTLASGQAAALHLMVDRSLEYVILGQRLSRDLESIAGVTEVPSMPVTYETEIERAFHTGKISKEQKDKLFDMHKLWLSSQPMARTKSSPVHISQYIDQASRK